MDAEHPSDETTSTPTTETGARSSGKRAARVPPADKKERDRVRYESLASMGEKLPDDAPLEALPPEPPPEPLSERQRADVVEPYVRSALAAANLVNLRFSGQPFMEGEMLRTVRESTTDTLTQFVPDMVLQRRSVLIASAVLKVAASILEHVLLVQAQKRAQRPRVVPMPTDAAPPEVAS